jgi:threonine aldolase
MSVDFSSDNITGAAPEMMAAIAAANGGTAHSYGDDAWSKRLTEVAQEVFETEIAIYPVATGTAANALALAVLCPPYGGVFCHETAHIEKDECGAPEFFSAGAKLMTVPGAEGKITAPALQAAHKAAAARGVHNVRPSAVSLSQATEWGTVYTPDEVSAITAAGRARGLRTHMDGARFGNALVHLGCAPADVTWRAGVDMLSLGATKNGAIAAEAVVIFDAGLAQEFEYRRKRAGQLFSKMRFSSAQLAAYLEDGLWLRWAANANAMAAKLAAGLAALPGVRLAAPVQANELFVVMQAALIARLEAAGFGFYRWPVPGMAADEDAIRLVTNWQTKPEEVDGFLGALRRDAGKQHG